ncbi:MAG TPA: DUF1587 domain-containing protein, partial [Thermohalobaculum sp.]|nr:DUF1587 domain-containing protein [Thermohalobaculum sp.]
WILDQLAAAEQARAPLQRVMRRLNRNEYNNTIKDLLGISQQVGDVFPQDATAGGFDNNGSALTVSPLHVELYYDAAMQALDYAIHEGRQPRPIEWRFDPEENTRGPDRLRVDRDGQRILLNPGNNEITRSRHRNVPKCGFHQRPRAKGAIQDERYHPRSRFGQECLPGSRHRRRRQRDRPTVVAPVPDAAVL